jgi:hypothetical protein
MIQILSAGKWFTGKWKYGESYDSRWNKSSHIKFSRKKPINFYFIFLYGGNVTHENVIRGNVSRGNVFSRKCVFEAMVYGEMALWEMVIRGNVPNPKKHVVQNYAVKNHAIKYFEMKPTQTEFCETRFQVFFCYDPKLNFAEILHPDTHTHAYLILYWNLPLEYQISKYIRAIPYGIFPAIFHKMANKFWNKTARGPIFSHYLY